MYLGLKNAKVGVLSTTSFSRVAVLVFAWYDDNGIGVHVVGRWHLYHNFCRAYIVEMHTSHSRPPCSCTCTHSPRPFSVAPPAAASESILADCAQV